MVWSRANKAVLSGAKSKNVLLKDDINFSQSVKYSVIYEM